MVNKLSIDCSCGWALHRLQIWPVEDYELFPELYVTVVNAPAEMNFIQRLRMAFFLLVGNEHVLSAIILDEQGTKQLVDYCSTLPHNPRTA